MPRPIHQCHTECGISPRGHLWLTPGSVRLGSFLVVSFIPRTDSSDITRTVAEFPVMTTLHDLDSANFFDGGNSGSRT